jgi:UDP-glucose 4-epimerase
MSGYHLILGGCGFIGRHVAALLAYNGYRVVLADRASLTTEFPPDIHDLISWRAFDLASADWDELIEGAEVIHHYAWSSIPSTAVDPVGDLVANVSPTLELLEALQRRGRERAPVLVFASSGGTVYGKLLHVPAKEDHPLRPVNLYGAGKAAVEHYLSVYRALHGLRCRIARLANPFGAGQDPSRGQGAVTTFLHHALTCQPIVIWGDGEVVRDYIHITDLAAGLVTLACTPAERDPWIFNIGSGHGVSVNGIIAALEIQLKRPIEVKREAGRAFDVPISVLDVTLAREVLGWTPKLSFSGGLIQTMTDLARQASLSALYPELDRLVGRDRELGGAAPRLSRRGDAASSKPMR